MIRIVNGIIPWNRFDKYSLKIILNRFSYLLQMKVNDIVLVKSKFGRNVKFAGKKGIMHADADAVTY